MRKRVFLLALSSFVVGSATVVAWAADDKCTTLACRVKDSDWKGGSGGPLNPQANKPIDDAAAAPKNDTSKPATLRTVP